MPDRHSQGVRDEALIRLKRRFSIGGVILLAVILLFYRIEIADWIAYSFSYLVWSLNVFGLIIPPQGVWIALLILIVYIAVGSFYGKVAAGGKSRREEKSRTKAEPVPGPVEAMAEWIEERGRGVYFKWRIARLLGRVRESQNRNSSGRLIPPPQNVEAYLTAGVNSSYMDFPTPGIFKKTEPTALDIELEPVLDYLEDQMEIQR